MHIISEVYHLFHFLPNKPHMYFCVSSGVSTAPGTTFTCTCLFPSCCVLSASLWRITWYTLVPGCRNLMLCLWITSLMLWMWHQWTLHSMWVKCYLMHLSIKVFHQIFFDELSLFSIISCGYISDYVINIYIRVGLYSLKG